MVRLVLHQCGRAAGNPAAGRSAADQNTKRIMKAMIRPNSPVASASAKPSRAGVVIWFCEAGLRAIELTSAAKMLPMPTPAPTRAMQARPAPIILAEARSMMLSFASVVCGGSVPVDGVVQVDAGQDGE